MKGHGWQVLAVIAVLLLLGLVALAIAQRVLISLADTFVGFFLLDLAVRVVLAPLSALAASVMYFELKRLHGEPVT